MIKAYFTKGRGSNMVYASVTNMNYCNEPEPDSWQIKEYPLQKCKSEDEAMWLCSVLNDAMERVNERSS